MNEGRHTILELFYKVFKYRELIIQFTKREVSTRYKASYMGRVWSLVTPLVMLSIYTFVFSVIFKAKWDFAITNSKEEFAITLFCGMLVFSIFSEMVTRSSSLIVSNPNYVKKVVFPLEILPISILGYALTNFFTGISILLVGQIIFLHKLTWTIFYIPLVLLPILFLSLGLSYILSSLGVYLRDIEHSIGLVVQALYFLTPIFYPATAIPAEYRGWLYINPLTGIVDNVRKVTVWGLQPDFNGLFIQLALSLVILQVGYWWFMKTRKGFADVL